MQMLRWWSSRLFGSPAHAERLARTNELARWLICEDTSRALFSNHEHAAQDLLGICIHTGPLVMTWIVPPQALYSISRHLRGFFSDGYEFMSDGTYKNKVAPSDPDLSLSEHRVLEEIDDRGLHYGLENLIEALGQPLADGYGRAFLINLYNSHHAFVLEQRSDDEIYLYQSFADRYNLKEYLRNPDAQKKWSVKIFVQKLEQILLSQAWSKEDSGAYEKLFNVRVDFGSIKKNYSDHRPLAFVESDNYLLGWLAQEHKEKPFVADHDDFFAYGWKKHADGPLLDFIEQVEALMANEPFDVRIPVWKLNISPVALEEIIFTAQNAGVTEKQIQGVLHYYFGAGIGNFVLDSLEPDLGDETLGRRCCLFNLTQCATSFFRAALNPSFLRIRQSV